MWDREDNVGKVNDIESWHNFVDHRTFILLSLGFWHQRSLKPPLLEELSPVSMNPLSKPISPCGLYESRATLPSPTCLRYASCGCERWIFWLSHCTLSVNVGHSVLVTTHVCVSQVKTVELPGGLLEDHFDTTVKMSTYLLAYIVSDFLSVSKTTQHGVKVRVTTALSLLKSIYLFFFTFFQPDISFVSRGPSSTATHQIPWKL